MMRKKRPMIRRCSSRLQQRLRRRVVLGKQLEEQSTVAVGSRRRTSSTAEKILPMIDLSPLLASHGTATTEKEVGALSQKLLAAAREYGFFYLKGHCVSPGEQQRAIANSRAFFELPQTMKDAIPPITAGGFTRGYIPAGGESGSERLECKEAFSYGWSGFDGESSTERHKNGDNSLTGPNEWPSVGVPSDGWRTDMNDLYGSMVDTSHLITRALSLALGQRDDFLLQHCHRGHEISLMRLFCYYNYDAERLSKLRREGDDPIGSSPHTDWGFLTLILPDPTDTFPGLQIEHEGAWLEVPPVEGTILCNVGDYLSVLSGGRLKSPIHRVVGPPPPDGRRLSFVFFFYPDYTARIEPMAAPAQQSAAAGYGLASGTFNTLLDLNEDVDIPFGEYLAKKWDGVYRSTL